MRVHMHFGGQGWQPCLDRRGTQRCGDPVSDEWVRVLGIEEVAAMLAERRLEVQSWWCDGWRVG